jgi:hypothetical protein
MNHDALSASPFMPDHESGYEAWRGWKLASYPQDPAALYVSIEDPFNLEKQELEEIISKSSKVGTVIYQASQGDAEDKSIPWRIGTQLGLERLDGNLCSDQDSLSSLCVREGGSRQEGYIPYTNKPLSWHTDGYYNPPDRQIRAMVLHCARPAASGGENQLLDPEILYIQLRDENPAFIEALMQADVMTIPPNIENGVEIRGAQSGPVFSVHPVTGTLHCRYTARKRNIEWKDDAITRDAVACIEHLLNDDNAYIYTVKLSAGEGLISNNALHNRSGFIDDPETGQTRLIYRARYYDRIRGTEFSEIYKQEQEHAVAK